MTLYIGLMSGTSMDGIDAALVDVSTHQLLCGITKKYSPEAQAQLEHLVYTATVSLSSICQLNTLIGREFAQTTNELLLEAKVKPQDIRAIGSHGQTVCHNAKATIPYTLQLGCAHTIAALTGIQVVADFRTRDLINGGEGAPFAPIYHQELFKMQGDVALVNIGGIANISLISSTKPTQGWDVGPGNCLMDAWIQKHLGHSFDKEGAWAAQGMLIPALLESLLKDPFFALPFPKSIGKEYFSLAWLEPHLSKEFKACDVQATLLALTTYPIAKVMQDNERTKHLYLCGGGVHNKQLHDVLEQLLPGFTIQSTAHAGISPDYLEAMLFAWLAAQRLNNIPLDLSSITGAKGPAVLGVIYPN